MGMLPSAVASENLSAYGGLILRKTVIRYCERTTEGNLQSPVVEKL